MSLEVGFKVSSVEERPRVFANPDVELSVTTSTPCLLVCCEASHHENIGLYLLTVSQLQLKFFLKRIVVILSKTTPK